MSAFPLETPGSCLVCIGMQRGTQSISERGGWVVLADFGHVLQRGIIGQDAKFCTFAETLYSPNDGASLEIEGRPIAFSTERK